MKPNPPNNPFATPEMPKMNDIPKEFRNMNSRNKWNRFQQDWFFNSVPGLQVWPKEEIDPEKALQHLSGIQRSYEPKHEHKVASVAYLASLWFDDITYDGQKRD